MPKASIDLHTPKAKIWKVKLETLLKRLATTSLPEVFLVSIFVLERWWSNSDFSYPSEIFIPLILFGVLTSAGFYLYKRLMPDNLSAHIAALALGYSLYAYQFIENSWLGIRLLKVLPHNLATPLTKSLFLVVILGLIYALGGWSVSKMINRYQSIARLQLYKVLLFAILFVFMIQLFKVGSRLLDIHKELSYRYPSPALTKPAKSSIQPKPDIYYLEYEDYTNAQVLKDVYHYDETPFLDFLASQGFVNRPAAYSNYPVTTSSIASTLAMNYLPEFGDMFGEQRHWQTAFPYRDIINDPPLTKILKQSGYQFDMLSSWWDFTRLGIKADSNPTISYRLKILNKPFFLSDLQRDMLNKSVLSPWLKKGLSLGRRAFIKYDLDRNPKENFLSQQAALEKIVSRTDNSTPHFIFGFYLLPHTPYIFNADGSPTAYDVERNDNGADENIKYANQVAYLNGQIEKTIKLIKSHSPNAVIIIQSDEGSYPKSFRFELTPNHYYNPINLSIPEMRQKTAILASYYTPGVDPALTSKELSSSVNAFRFVLNQYLGYNLPMLPDCHFAAGDKYSLYNYQLITDKLTGQSAPAACQQYE